MTSVDPAIPEPHSRGTILLVEDEPFLREATARLLQSSGFDVIEAAEQRGLEHAVGAGCGDPRGQIILQRECQAVVHVHLNRD